MTFSEKDIERLASFPEQNPNPVLELALSGRLNYCNQATLLYFPDIRELGIGHPLFDAIRSLIERSGFSALHGYRGEVKVSDLVFEQKVFHIEGSGVLRVYSTDITERKRVEEKLTWLSLFPEQNPNPVIEADTVSGKVTYLNPAARSRFPELEKEGTGHALFTEVMKRIGIGKDFQCEVTTGRHIFAQRVYFLPGTALIRLYSNDITEQKQVEKNLSRLASFPEQNPSPIIEVDLQGNISYFNPACLIQFPDFYEQKWEHVVMLPLKERFGQLKSGAIAVYETEVRYGQKYFTQRARFMPDAGVIRMFNLDITLQKQSEETIREKNKDITDSINYAKKIQRAILPSEEFLLGHFEEAFVLYRPKDIISGDFYWYSVSGEHFIFACADCTGHGVPGALMSMIGSNLLSHIVSEREIITPGGALLELDRRVRKALKQDEETDSKDGMDIAFCSLHVKNRVLHYSAANRPLIIIRKGEIMEYAPSKFPVGGQFQQEKAFGENEIILEEGDVIYAFTDGITDQFGGPKGKKWMKKRFLETLLGFQQLSMQEQKAELLKAFDEWKGALEQVDDVLVMGIRV
jgi:serine phosphatase RsbU (regulator of sigma subunit)/PAS domain-containing protein